MSICDCICNDDNIFCQFVSSICLTQINITFINLFKSSVSFFQFLSSNREKSSRVKQCVFLLADGQILPTSRRQEVSQNGTLVLRQVDSSTDRGAYTCTAKNKQGRSDSQTIHIEVKGKVSLLHIYFFSLFLFIR